MKWTNKKEVMNFWWCIEKGLPFIVFDTETTGLKKTDYIIQFAANRYEKRNGQYEQTESINVFIKPPVIMEQSLVDIHGISNEFLEDKPTEEFAFSEIRDFIAKVPDTVLCAYNIAFDLKMTKAMYDRNKEPFEPKLMIDIYKVAKSVVDKDFIADKQLKLGNVYRFCLDTGAWSGRKEYTFHDASEDILATWEVGIFLLERFKQTPAIPENQKQKPKLKKMTKFEKGKYVKRIYCLVELETGQKKELYYDIYSSEWRDSKEEDPAIDTINMNLLEAEAWETIKSLGLKTFSSFKGVWKAS